jgi:transketolase
MFAAHRRLGRLSVVIDANDSQVDGAVASVTTLEPLAEKWRAFGWRVAEVDGHDVDALWRAFAARHDGFEPFVIIARTQISGRLRAVPPTVDGHFIKLDAALKAAITTELEAALA